MSDPTLEVNKNIQKWFHNLEMHQLPPQRKQQIKHIIVNAQQKYPHSYKDIQYEIMDELEEKGIEVKYILESPHQMNQPIKGPPQSQSSNSQSSQYGPNQNNNNSQEQQIKLLGYTLQEKPYVLEEKQVIEKIISVNLKNQVPVKDIISTKLNMFQQLPFLNIKSRKEIESNIGVSHLRNLAILDHLEKNRNDLPIQSFRSIINNIKTQIRENKIIDAQKFYHNSVVSQAPDYFKEMEILYFQYFYTYLFFLAMIKAWETNPVAIFYNEKRLEQTYILRYPKMYTDLIQFQIYSNSFKRSTKENIMGIIFNILRGDKENPQKMKKRQDDLNNFRREIQKLEAQNQNILKAFIKDQEEKFTKLKTNISQYIYHLFINLYEKLPSKKEYIDKLYKDEDQIMIRCKTQYEKLISARQEHQNKQKQQQQQQFLQQQQQQQQKNQQSYDQYQQNSNQQQQYHQSSSQSQQDQYSQPHPQQQQKQYQQQQSQESQPTQQQQVNQEYSQQSSQQQQQQVKQEYSSQQPQQASQQNQIENVKIESQQQIQTKQEDLNSSLSQQQQAQQQEKQSLAPPPQILKKEEEVSEQIQPELSHQQSSNINLNASSQSATQSQKQKQQLKESQPSQKNMNARQKQQKQQQEKEAQQQKIFKSILDPELLQKAVREKMANLKSQKKISGESFQEPQIKYNDICQEIGLQFHNLMKNTIQKMARKSPFVSSNIDERQIFVQRTNENMTQRKKIYLPLDSQFKPKFNFIDREEFQKQNKKLQNIDKPEQDSHHEENTEDNNNKENNQNITIKEIIDRDRGMMYNFFQNLDKRIDKKFGEELFLGKRTFTQFSEIAEQCQFNNATEQDLDMEADEDNNMDDEDSIINEQDLLSSSENSSSDSESSQQQPQQQQDDDDFFKDDEDEEEEDEEEADKLYKKKLKQKKKREKKERKTQREILRQKRQEQIQKKQQNEALKFKKLQTKIKQNTIEQRKYRYDLLDSINGQIRELGNLQAINEMEIEEEIPEIQENEIDHLERNIDTAPEIYIDEQSILDFLEKKKNMNPMYAYFYNKCVILYK